MKIVSVSHIVLLLVALIWGFAFVAQSAGMDHLGPHSFNAARFALATVALLPLWFYIRAKQRASINTSAVTKGIDKSTWVGGLVAGAVMFFGFSFQQVGLQYTTAGNAGFITGMYIVMVPLFGVLLGQHTAAKTWGGIALAIVGLYLLSIGPDFSMRYGDVLELIGALFWAVHVLVISKLAKNADAVSLAIIQMAVAAVLATIAMLVLESPQWVDFQSAGWSLAYAGIASSAIGFTLQVFAQRKVSPSVTALILSSEAVFAVLGGWLLLNEDVTLKILVGCTLMLMGMLMSQWPSKRSDVQ